MGLIIHPGMMGPRGARPGLMSPQARTGVVAGSAVAPTGVTGVYPIGGLGYGMSLYPFPYMVAQFQEQAYRQVHHPPPLPPLAPPPAPAQLTDPASATDRRIAQLTQLAALHKQGSLTDEEFAKQKALILDAISG